MRYFQLRMFLRSGLLVLPFAFLTLVASAGAQAVGTDPKPGNDASAPQKDVLIFTNGDQLSGKLERGVGDTVVFQSDMAGEITVPLSKVKELRSAGQFAVLQHGVPVAESRKVQPGRIEITGEGVVQQLPSGATEAPIPIKSVAYIVDEDTFRRDLTRDPGFLAGWNGNVQFGTTFVQATTHGGTLTAGVALVRQIPVLTFFSARNRTMLNVNEAYGIMTTPAIPATNSGYSQVKTSIFHAEGERDEYFSKRGYVLGDTTFDHNYAQGLQLQQVYGVGVGYTVFSTPVQQLDVKAQVQFERQAFFTADGATAPSEPVQNLIGSTFSEHYHRVLPRKMVFTQELSILPAWNVLNDYSGNGSAALTMPVFKRLSLSLGATDAYLNNPQPGYQKNSFQFTTGVAYSVR